MISLSLTKTGFLFIAAKRRALDSELVDTTMDLLTSLQLAVPISCENETDVTAALERRMSCEIPIFTWPVFRKTLTRPDVASQFCNPYLGESSRLEIIINDYLAEQRYSDANSEMDGARLHSTCIVKLFRLFSEKIFGANGFIVDKDRAETPGRSTLDVKRPDVMCRTVRGVLLFKGEDKRVKTMAALEGAQIELLAKMASWKPIHMGSIPFILGHAAAGSLVQFCCIRPCRQGDMTGIFCDNKHTLCLTSDILDVDEPQDRLRFVLIVINAFRILVASRSAAPSQGAHGLFQKIERPSGTLIMFCGDYVEKTYSIISLSHATAGLNNDAFYELLQNLQRSAPEFLEHPSQASAKFSLRKYRDNSICVQMIPSGFSLGPTNIDEFRAAIRCVLLGLKVLHAMGWIHNDVRWPNVVKVTADHWCLIDLDHARQLSQDTAASPARDFCTVATLFSMELARSSAVAVAFQSRLVASTATSSVDSFLSDAFFTP